jgi:hypothetical protein
MGSSGEDQPVGAGQGPTWPPPVSSWAAGWGAAPAASSADQPVDQTDGATETAPAWPTTWPVEPTADDTAAPTDSGDRNVEAATTVDVVEPAAEEPDLGVSLAAVDASPRGEPTSDPAARALALIDELRALVPQLTAEAAAEIDAEAIAADLEAAIRPAADEPAGEQEGLRTALLTARERPRDIDTMLDLVGRVDAVLALLDAHDRAVAAIERAVRSLRGRGEEPDPA